MSSIGLLNEKPLHASLKAWIARPGDRFEVEVDGYVIDIVRGDLLIEIQTGNFASIKSKLTTLLREHRVRLVFPVAVEKWIVKQADEDGAQASRRKSPKRGRVEDLFRELVSFPTLMTHPNFAIEVLMIREEEIRRFDENRNWRRRGWGTVERRLLDVVDRKHFLEPADWRDLLPEGLESFTAKDLAEAAGIRRPLAQKMAYCLRKARIIELTGKQGRAHLYSIT